MNKGSGAGGSICQLLGSLILSKYDFISTWLVSTAFLRNVFWCLQNVILMICVQGNLNPLGKTYKLVRSWDCFVGIMWH